MMNNPFDARFKLLAEGHPDLMLRLLGIIGPGKKRRITSILRELTLDAVQIDHAYFVNFTTLVHFEAITKWDPGRISRLALYRFLLREKHQVKVVSYVVLMAEKYAPKVLPDVLVYEDDDGLRIETKYKVIRLWEIDPKVAFKRGAEPLLPWVPLLKSGVAECERAVDAIEQLMVSCASVYSPAMLIKERSTNSCKG